MHDRAQLSRRRAGAAAGFTLIEILIVVVILGILAAIVMPQFSNASTRARENTLRDELRYLRTQIAVYTAQHRDVPPGYPGANSAAAPTEADFVSQMTSFTSDTSTVSATATAACHFGPYLTRMPTNPVSNKGDIKIVANGQPMPAPDGTTGWIYKPQSQELLPNLTGNDQDGLAYSQY